MNSVAGRIDQHWQHIIAQLHHQAATGNRTTIVTATEEETVSIAQALDDVEAGLKSGLAKFQSVDRGLINVLEVINSNPETAPALSFLFSLAGANIPPGIIAKTLGSLEGLAMAYAPPAPAAAAA